MPSGCQHCVLKHFKKSKLYMMESTVHPFTRLLYILRAEKSEISSIYVYAGLIGLIQLSLPLGVQSIISFVLAGKLSSSLVVLISFLVVAVLIAGVMQLKQLKIIERIQQKIFVNNSYAFADRIPRLDPIKVDAYYLPELVNRFFDTITLQKGIAKLLLDLPISIIQIVLGLIILSFYHPFFIAFAIFLLLLLWLILYGTARHGLNTSLEESVAKYRLVAWFEEVARMMTAFKFSNAHRLHMKEADRKTLSYLHFRTRHFSVLLMQFRSLIAFRVVITAAILIVGVVLLLNQQINIGQFVATEIIILMLLNSIEKIIINLDSIYDVMTATEKIAKLTDKPTEIYGSYRSLPAGPFSVEARNLAFSYVSGRQAVSDTNFNIRPGQVIVLSGAGGGGKSTLLRLLSGMYPEHTGALLINGVPICNYDLDLLRNRIGAMFVNDNIFHGSLWENLTMGRGEIDAPYLTWLCDQTGLKNYSSNLSAGFDTILDPHL
ncbi:MAG: ATP-binding cassette domain-containing protein [Chitinophagaceae bacterium]|nr:MAG: ATP-binding cassette domain-containing protein [Chitinophagaceae bacterium]